MWPYFTEGTVTEISKSVVGPWPFDLLMNQCTYLNQFYYLNSRTLPWHNETSEVDGTTQLAIGAMPSLHSEKPVAIPGISAAIRAGSPNEQNAYAFIKILLSKVCQSQLWLTAPVLKEQIAYHMEHDVETKDRTEDGSAAAYAMFTDILPYQQFSTKQWEIYVQYMTPYWEGNASYEKCVSELEAMLELYMYE